MYLVTAVAERGEGQFHLRAPAGLIDLRLDRPRGVPVQVEAVLTKAVCPLSRDLAVELDAHRICAEYHSILTGQKAVDHDQKPVGVGQARIPAGVRDENALRVIVMADHADVQGVVRKANEDLRLL